MKINMGECYVCKKPVMVTEGKSCRYYTEILKRFNGDEISRISSPVHKKCEKHVDNGG